MSWTNELYKVYELAVGTEEGNGILPLSHIKTKANISITINENGELTDNGIFAVFENAETIVPDTGKAKVGKYPPPYPLNESLRYIAGDFNDFISENIKDNVRNFDDYIKQLEDWKNSEYSHRAVNAIYNYVIKKTVIFDCIASGVLKTDENTNKLIDKQLGVSVDKIFVRFLISYQDKVVETWKDTSLYEAFNDYLASKATDKRLCYATGKMRSSTYTHPMGILKNNARAKLISTNDDKNFTYRGRFSNKEEAIAVSYDYSQKMHNALKWLIGRQSRSFDSLTLLTWNSALGFVPSITKSAFELFDDEEEEYDTVPMFSELLNKSLLGSKLRIEPDKKVMIMGLDAATTGRLSIAIYTELAESFFYANLEKWHKETAWKRFNSKLGRTVEDSCSLPQIANCLYGTEQNGFLNCEKKLMGDLVLRLIPCVTEGKKLPHDIVMTLSLKASSPLSYDNEYNHRIVLENACALIRKEQADHDNKLYCEGEIKMAYDPNCTDRSYLYGCLLAIADKAESDTYEKGEKRVTNARRLWNAFSSRPYQTWQIIEERLEPYLEKEQWAMTKYTKRINEIMGKFSPEEFADNSKLSPLYLIGFHHYNSMLWDNDKDNDNNKEESL